MYAASVIALGVGLLVQRHFVSSSRQMQLASAHIPSIPSDWKTYQGLDSTSFGVIRFTLRYPPDWVMVGNKWSFTYQGKSGWAVLDMGGTWGQGKIQLIRNETRNYHGNSVTVTEYRRLQDNVIAGSYWFEGTYYGQLVPAFGFAAEYEASHKDEFNQTFDTVLSSVRFLN